MWRELIGGLFEDAVFRPPAPAEAIVAVEGDLKVEIPDDLKSLLAESNGVVARYSTSLVWPVEEIASMPTEELLDEIGIPLTPVRLKCAVLGLGVL